MVEQIQILGMRWIYRWMRVCRKNRKASAYSPSVSWTAGPELRNETHLGSSERRYVYWCTKTIHISHCSQHRWTSWRRGPQGKERDPSTKSCQRHYRDNSYKADCRVGAEKSTVFVEKNYLLYPVLRSRPTLAPKCSGGRATGTLTQRQRLDESSRDQYHPDVIPGLQRHYHCQQCMRSIWHCLCLQ